MTDVAASPGNSNVSSATPDTMSWDSRARRVMMIYLPLSCFVLILLFPFYWMAITSFKPNAELLNFKDHNPFWITSPTLAHIKHLLFNTAYPTWLWTTMIVAVGSTFLSLFASTLAPMRSSGCASRAAPTWARHLPRLSGAALDPVHSAGHRDRAVRPVRLADGADPGVSDLPGAVLHLAPDRLFQVDPVRAGGMRAGGRRDALQILRRITLPLAVPGLISAGIFSFTLSWNEFIYALAFIQSGANKTVPVAILTELVTGDVYQWGALMAGSLLGSLPVALFYSLFVGLLRLVTDGAGEGVTCLSRAGPSDAASSSSGRRAA
jgi:multiple sugar transport system permease protein